MTLVFLIAVGLAGVLNYARDQRRAIEAVVRAGGKVVFDFERVECGGPDAPAEPPGPRWLRSLIGDEWFRDVAWVDLAEIGVDEELMAHVAHFQRLEVLVLSRTTITDRHLRHLSRLYHLGELNLIDTRVGDVGMISLRNLRSLKELYLNGTSVGDEGLFHLNGLVGLEYLLLTKTPVSDAGLIELGNLGKLYQLNLENTNVKGPGLIALGKLKNLGNLSLSRPAYDNSQELNKIRPDIDISLDEPYQGPEPTSIE